MWSVLTPRPSRIVIEETREISSSHWWEQMQPKIRQSSESPTENGRRDWRDQSVQGHEETRDHRLNWPGLMRLTEIREPFEIWSRFSECVLVLYLYLLVGLLVEGQGLSLALSFLCGTISSYWVVSPSSFDVMACALLCPDWLMALFFSEERWEVDMEERYEGEIGGGNRGEWGDLWY